LRILHTADWHAGRTLRGVDRTPEIAQALEEIIGLARSERADLILVSGDLFDTPNPSAEAEAAVYEFFLRAGELGVPSVVIAGNHDSAQRIESVSGLLRRVQVRAVGQARLARDGGVVEVQTASGETALVAALPFLSERRLVKAAQLLDTDVAQWRQKYREGMAFFVDRLASAYRADTVNLMMLHTTLDGGALSGSEFKFYVTNSYTISADSLPASAQYVALGHLHRAQRLREGPPVDYSGSVIQLDFGEAGEQKSVRLVEARPGLPATVHEVPLSSGKPLKNARVDADGLERRLEEFRSWPGYLKVRVTVDHPMPGLKDRVMNVLPQALAVEVEVDGEGAGGGSGIEPTSRLSTLEAYERYYLEKRGKDVPEEIRRAFLELQAEVVGDGEAAPDAATPDEAAELELEASLP
jgi:exonuclease SbcD